MTTRSDNEEKDSDMLWLLPVLALNNFTPFSIIIDPDCLLARADYPFLSKLNLLYYTSYIISIYYIILVILFLFIILY